MSGSNGGHEFEAEVRRVAEALWRMDPGQCQPQHYSDDPTIRELDGLAQLDDVTHILMATIETKLDKVRDSVRKLQAAKKIEERSGKLVKMWLVTKHQLDAQHIKHGRENGVIVLTLERFRTLYFKGDDYLEKRRTKPFGSARNLTDGRGTFDDGVYVELPMQLVFHSHRADRSQKNAPVSVNILEIARRLVRGETVVMMAPFGSGKSLTTREIFLHLRNEYRRGHSPVVPVAVNLREHWGAQYGDEILERHARSIGFEPRENLTSAWRAGVIVLLVDGFDEVAAPALSRNNEVNFMRKARADALKAVNHLVSETPSGVGILICGRDHYFDSPTELRQALGINDRPYAEVRLGEFQEEQAQEFLGRNKVTTTLPDWLPRKPLLLGYLVEHRLLNDVLKIDAGKGFGYTWSSFLELICVRESGIATTTMDPQVVRQVLERLACQVRSTVSGTGPITGVDLAEAYRVEAGSLPNESVLAQLQRLPGMTLRGHENGERSFVDEDMLAALQGSAVANLILGQLRDVDDRGWLSGLSTKAIDMASYMLREVGIPTIISACYQGIINGRRREGQLIADAIVIALSMAREEGYVDFRSVEVEEGSFRTIDLEDLKVDNLAIRSSAIDELILSENCKSGTIRFENCVINRVIGATSHEDLPQWIFKGCTVEKFDDVSTTSAIMRSDAFTPAMKALLTVLRKIYKQAGAGRKLSALRRGVTQPEVLDKVDAVMHLLESEKMIVINDEFVHPIRRQQGRVEKILQAPNTLDDAVLLHTRQL